MSKTIKKMRTISVKEYADQTGVPLATVYWQIHENKLPEGVSCVKVGNTYIIETSVKQPQQQ